MKRLRTAGALTLLLLPTQLPWWIDGLGAGPAPAGALRVLRGTVARRATLASLLDGTLSRAGVQRLVEAAPDLRKGEAFKVAVERPSRAGRFRRYGRLLAAELTRGRRVLRAVRFEGARGAGYYAPDGTSLRKAFLRSPLKFSRITSRFS